MQGLDQSVCHRWNEAHPTERLMVWVSGGKDAFCVLKLAVDALGPARVVPVYRYLVEGMRCVETPIRAQLARLGVEHPLVLVPGLDAVELLRTGTYNPPQSVALKPHRKVKFTDIEKLARKRTGCLWTAGGEKQADTVMRRCWLRPFHGIDEAGKRLYPVHLWSHHQVRALCQTMRVSLAPNFGAEVTSGLGFDVLDELKARYPDDYARLLHAFPFAEAVRVRDRVYGKRPRSHAQLRKLQAIQRGPHQVSDRDG
jgi:hypothetical protein